MGTPELGVMIVMVVVGAFPNAAGAQNQDSKQPHNSFGQAGMRQYCLMLLIVINHKKPQIKQPGEHAAQHLAHQVETPESPRQSAQQQQRGGKQIRPTLRRPINCVRLGGQNNLFSMFLPARLPVCYRLRRLPLPDYTDGILHP